MTKLLLTLALVAAECTTTTPPPAPAPSPEPTDPDGAAPYSVKCKAPCAQLAALGCDDAKPTPGGATCVDVCAGIARSGTVPYPFDCVNTAKSCAGAERCFR